MITWWTLRRLKSSDYLTRDRAKQKLIDAQAIKPLIGVLSDEQSGPTALEALVKIGSRAERDMDARGCR